MRFICANIKAISAWKTILCSHRFNCIRGLWFKSAISSKRNYGDFPFNNRTPFDDFTVVQIIAEGSFLDPGEWNINVGASGTGFIIDPSGIAVTNNHVVAGSATLKVWLAGDSNPRTARVLGVAECSDLAVIEIDGDNFPFLDWYPGDIKVGMDVYTAG